jgi:hypothetical protein
VAVRDEATIEAKTPPNDFAMRMEVDQPNGLERAHHWGAIGSSSDTPDLKLKALQGIPSPSTPLLNMQ